MPEETTTTYAVHSTNTGALVCGPYEDIGEANRENRRLNREAIRGRTDPSERYPQGQELAKRGDPQLMHRQEPQAYEVRTNEGVVVLAD